MSEFRLPPYPPYRPPTPPEPEEFLGQIWADSHWVDYARGTEASSRRWQAEKPAERRVIDWISHEVKMNSTCPVEGTHVKHLDPHEELRPHGVVIFTCGACGITMVD